MAECNVVKKNLGLSRCNKLPSLPKSMISTPASFFIPAATITSGAAAIETFLQDAILDGRAERIYLWPNFVGFENISEEAVYEDSPLAYLPVRDGNYRFKFHVSQNTCLHKGMFTHRAKSGRVFIYDIENQLNGTEDDAGNFYGFTIQLLHTEKFMLSDGSTTTKSPVVVALADNKEWDQHGAILDAPFVNRLERLADVELTVSSASTTTIVVSVKVECDGTPVNGLVTDDFVLLDAAGDEQTITAVETGDGVYTLTGTDLEDGTLNLVSANTLSIQAYEALAAVDVDVA